MPRPLLQRQDKLGGVLVHQLNDFLEVPADNRLVVDLKKMALLLSNCWWIGEQNKPASLTIVHQLKAKSAGALVLAVITVSL